MNRRDHPQSANYSGELSWATPLHLDDGRFVLALALEIKRGEDTDDILWSHELGHWILLMQGFKAVRFRDIAKDDEVMRLTEAELNSLAQHPPLYELQRSVGFDPQGWIDARTESEMETYRNKLPMACTDQTFLGLVAADCLMTSSAILAGRFQATLQELNPTIAQIATDVVKLGARYHLLTPEGNRRFLLRMIEQLRPKPKYRFTPDPLSLIEQELGEAGNRF